MTRNWLDLILHIQSLEQRFGRFQVLNEQAADLAMIEMLKKELAQRRGL